LKYNKELVLDLFTVKLTELARRQLLKVPTHIVRKLMSWIDGIEKDGLSYMRKIPGYHDEPLRGKRAGERSIRLSKAYRAIYILDHDGKVELIKITEVTKHDY
jgi:toxin HigB-1